MYELTVESTFAAAHAIRIGSGNPDGGFIEPLHGHNWHVTATVAGSQLDADGLLCDFHTIEDALREITGRFQNQNLNAIEPFASGPAGTPPPASPSWPELGSHASSARSRPGLNPTAELIARFIAEELSSAIDASLAPHARLVSVRVTEAVGCAATYLLPRATG